MIARHAQRHPKPFLAAFLALVVAALATLQAQTPGATSSAPADSSEAKAAAVAAMEKWLAGIDAGDYAASWNEAAGSFQKALPSATWVAALNAVRAPLGALESRKLVSAMQQSGIPAPTGQMMKGDFVIAQFDTAFANLKYARETVTFEWEDGAWKASGYYIKPR